MTTTLLQGDCRQVLKTLPEKSVQTCVTSPPYWQLRRYDVEGDQIGDEPTPAEYVAALVDTFCEVRRVLRDDGTLWVNLGDSYHSDGGKRIYGSSDGVTGRGPGIERRPQGLGDKQLLGIPWRVAFALQDDGWILRSDIIWHKPNPMPESVTDRPTRAHEYLFLFSKQARYYYDSEAIAERATRGYDKPGGGHQRQVVHGGAAHRGLDAYAVTNGARNRRTVWTVATRPYKEAHFATFPEALIEPCILAGSRPGDLILDPFAGSGTTGRVAQRFGRGAVLIDLGYLDLQQRRTDGVQVEMEAYL